MDIIKSSSIAVAFSCIGFLTGIGVGDILSYKFFGKDPEKISFERKECVDKNPNGCYALIYWKPYEEIKK